jgi:hypothetical protein
MFRLLQVLLLLIPTSPILTSSIVCAFLFPPPGVVFSLALLCVSANSRVGVSLFALDRLSTLLLGVSLIQLPTIFSFYLRLSTPLIQSIATHKLESPYTSRRFHIT